MAKRHTKKEAVSIAISSARLYRDNFVGKRLLFLMTDKHRRVFSLEVGFDASNFQHLTGLSSTNTFSSISGYQHPTGRMERRVLSPLFLIFIRFMF